MRGETKSIGGVVCFMAGYFIFCFDDAIYFLLQLLANPPSPPPPHCTKVARITLFARLKKKSDYICMYIFCTNVHAFRMCALQLPLSLWRSRGGGGGVGSFDPFKVPPIDSFGARFAAELDGTTIWSSPPPKQPTALIE
jgi:hypothetical protein